MVQVYNSTSIYATSIDYTIIIIIGVGIEHVIQKFVHANTCIIILLLNCTPGPQILRKHGIG